MDRMANKTHTLHQLAHHTFHITITQPFGGLEGPNVRVGVLQRHKDLGLAFPPIDHLEQIRAFNLFADDLVDSNLICG